MTIEDETRHKMKSYWEEHRSVAAASAPASATADDCSTNNTAAIPSSTATVETMMLDTNAKQLHALEIPEVLEKAPDFAGLDVLELAAGIGRYTGLLAQTARHVTAVEFIGDFHKANVAAHGHLGNVSFECQDVVDFSAAPRSFDIVFSNWLFMYLSDDEVRAFAAKAVHWLRPGGRLFFRESCFRQSGDVKRGENPTYYRHPSFYVAAFGAVRSDEGNDGVGVLELESSSSISVYRKLKRNHGQICFTYVKQLRPATSGDADVPTSFQHFLDEHQYSTRSITRYEKIFGAGYVSTGGQGTTTEFVAKLGLQKGERVLDVGCGIGGGDLYMAREFGASVLGIDLSTNMVHRALEAAMAAPELDVEFEVCDATQRDFPPESFDVIYSRDTILHIADKAALFRRFFRWLKPGGRVLISDYCRGDVDGTPHFQAYVASRGYHLLSPAQYGKTLEAAGFSAVEAHDRTGQFVDVLNEELARTKAIEAEFVRETSAQDFADIVNGWEAKLVRCAEGDQKWGLFFGRKQ